MRAAGVEIVQDASEVAVVGFVEVLKHLPQLLRAMRRVRNVIDTRPALVVPIDYPGFNIRLCKHAKRARSPVVWFVSPQVWAWRKGRLKELQHLVHRMLVLFPFEVAVYERVGIPVDFVGHPIAEPRVAGPTREELCAATGLSPDARLVALMPGSRRSEVERLLADMLGAAQRIAAKRPDVQFLLPVASGLDPGWVQQRVAEGAPGLTVGYTAGPFPQVLEHCVAGVVASGTASLEAASVGLPLVVVYRVTPLSFAIAKRVVDLEHVALPNLIAQERVVPELLQHDCHPESIAAELARYLDDEPHRLAVRDRLLAVRETLGEPGLYRRAAESILKTLDSAGDYNPPGGAN